MFPNPQDALPLPPRPNLEQYKKQAKDLIKACKSGDPDGIRPWAAKWVRTLVGLAGLQITAHLPVEVERWVDQVEEFARRKLWNSESKKYVLADAQFVIARSHGFLSWTQFARHIAGLTRGSSPVSRFEAAADAIVTGDAATLERLLREDPELIRVRSTREHRATLLHYVSANGVEGYRQKSPKNAVKIAELLLKAGADVDAEADVWGGGATTLGLVATSIHPEHAGVQDELMGILLQYGAAIDSTPGAAVNSCLANGRPQAAEFLAKRGAPLDLEAAAGVGRLDVVKSFFNEDGSLKATATKAQMKDGFTWACEYGRTGVADFLLQRGIDVSAKLRHHGQTGLHWAACGAHVDTVKLLLDRKAAVNAKDETWGNTPLGWALYGWGEAPSRDTRSRYYKVAALLVAAGATVKPEWLADEKVRADPRMLAALSGEMSR